MTVEAIVGVAVGGTVLLGALGRVLRSISPRRRRSRRSWTGSGGTSSHEDTGMHVRWLIRRDTRHARWLVLRLRLRVLRYGDDFAETMTASLASVYSVVLLFPGDTTGHAPAWRVLRELCGGDLGLGALFLILAVALWLAVLRLISDTLRQAVLVLTLAVWVGMAVGFFLGYPSSLGPYLSLLYALTAWFAYLRGDPT